MRSPDNHMNLLGLQERFCMENDVDDAPVSASGHDHQAQLSADVHRLIVEHGPLSSGRESSPPQATRRGPGFPFCR